MNGGSMKRNKNGRTDLTRNVFRDADGDRSPDISRLLQRTEELVARAARDERPNRPDVLIDLVPLAWNMIPRFALGAAVLVAVSVGWSWVGESGVTIENPNREVENLILGGEGSSGGSDLLLNAIAGREGSDG